jgi:hypothetical protein
MWVAACLMTVLRSSLYLSLTSLDDAAAAAAAAVVAACACMRGWV